ncbi:DUF4388 domain-containing protein [Engelhardtia mirabilis]|uniref:PatA-like N-terminal domain-containing protein n=1 Tax=Engelhardtia mirabilis TaxID=2528011 RepID=A0A518BKG9_9BACT|nr:hypothetical protein Pla133_25490 [Planctomycetes bacterium Pla133]QDV01792.1 hypothetical protein Pla86_25480 [Planctomycetes bacterium Pla86]
MHSDISTDHEELIASGRVLAKRLESLRHAAKTRVASQEFQDAVEGAVAALERGLGLLGEDLESTLNCPHGSTVIAQRMLAAVTMATDEPGTSLGADEDAAGDWSAGVSGQAALSGTTEMLSMADLLELLGSLQKTGELEVQTEKETITIELRAGKLVHAMTNHTPAGERLGEILVKLGYVTETHLEAFARGFVGTGRKLGEVLESGSLVTADQLATALAEQIQQLFVRLYSSSHARFVFKSKDVNGGGNQKVEIGLRKLLFESARISDEQSYG